MGLVNPTPIFAIPLAEDIQFFHSDLPYSTSWCTTNKAAYYQVEVLCSNLFPPQIVTFDMASSIFSTTLADRAIRFSLRRECFLAR